VVEFDPQEKQKRGKINEKIRLIRRIFKFSPFIICFFAFFQNKTLLPLLSLYFTENPDPLQSTFLIRGFGFLPKKIYDK
jgi:hypothetical protein